MATKSRKLARKIALIPTKEVNEEAKIIWKINMMSVTKETSCLHKLLEKHNLWKILCITAWIIRFIFNLTGKPRRSIRFIFNLMGKPRRSIRFIFNLTGKPRRCGVLSTFELQEALNYWIKVMQNEALTDPSFEDMSNRLGLSEDEEGLLCCRGRIIGENPLYLPSKHAFTKLVIEDAYLKTLYGGVTLTKTREIWWVEKLGTLVKGVLHKCEKSKRYRTQPHSRQLVLTLLDHWSTKGSRQNRMWHFTPVQQQELCIWIF